MAEINVNEMIDGYVTKAQKALNEFMALNQEQIDAIVKAMTLAGLDKHMELAKMAVEETGRGVYEDKITKNMFIIQSRMKKQLVLLLKTTLKITKL